MATWATWAGRARIDAAIAERRSAWGAAFDVAFDAAFDAAFEPAFDAAVMGESCSGEGMGRVSGGRLTEGEYRS